MASIIVCDRTLEGKSSRKRIGGVDLKDVVKNFKVKCSNDLGKPADEFELVYCGQCLNDDSTLESCGLHSGSTLHALVRQNHNFPSGKGEISNADIKQVRELLQGAIQNPAYRSTIEKIMNCPETLHDIVNAIPGLDSNPATLALFQDSELLRVLTHPGNIRRVMEAHPCFVQLARTIAAAVKEAGSKADFVRTTPGSYSLDQMSDDEDTPGASGGQPITANQLAAALAAATGSPVPSSSSSQPRTSQSQPIGNQMITPDFFQQAILQAQSAAMSGQLQQMRDMGITDENRAREALQVTNGDLQAALDLIFSGGMS